MTDIKIISKPAAQLTFSSFFRILRSAIATEAIFPVAAKGSWNRATSTARSIVEFSVSKYVIGFANDGGDVSHIEYVKFNGQIIAKVGTWNVLPNDANCPTDLLSDHEFRSLESILRNS